jgi:predicted DsbA family dithiol-disulfide isomerase
VRLRRIKAELGDDLQVATRSFLLRPYPDADRTLEQFRTYTRSWLRPAADPDAPAFRPWEGGAGPPSHSVPPHLVAKAAATLGPDAFDRIDARLMRAYFAENRDITDEATLRALWRDVGLPDDAFARAADPALVRQTIDEHNEALAYGVTGVPAARIDGVAGLVVGAQSVDVYRRWIERRLRTP